MSESRPPEPPETAQQALRRAGLHARRSVAEAIAALRALLDAGALAGTGPTSEELPQLAALAAGLDDLQRALDVGDGLGEARLFDAVADALDAEIARWEERSKEDRDARPVLRAFLGLREILWELGVRSRPEPDPEDGGRPRRRGAGRPARGRIQRIHVDG